MATLQEILQQRANIEAAKKQLEEIRKKVAPTQAQLRQPQTVRGKQLSALNALKERQKQSKFRSNVSDQQQGVSEYEREFETYVAKSTPEEARPEVRSEMQQQIVDEYTTKYNSELSRLQDYKDKLKQYESQLNTNPQDYDRIISQIDEYKEKISAQQPVVEVISNELQTAKSNDIDAIRNYYSGQSSYNINFVKETSKAQLKEELFKQQAKQQGKTIFREDGRLVAYKPEEVSSLGVSLSLFGGGKIYDINQIKSETTRLKNQGYQDVKFDTKTGQISASKFEPKVGTAAYETYKQETIKQITAGTDRFKPIILSTGELTGFTDTVAGRSVPLSSFEKGYSYSTPTQQKVIVDATKPSATGFFPKIQESTDKFITGIGEKIGGTRIGKTLSGGGKAYFGFFFTPVTQSSLGGSLPLNKDLPTTTGKEFVQSSTPYSFVSNPMYKTPNSPPKTEASQVSINSNKGSLFKNVLTTYGSSFSQNYQTGRVQSKQIIGATTNIGTYFIPVVGSTRFGVDVMSFGERTSKGEKTSLLEKVSIATPFILGGRAVLKSLKTPAITSLAVKETQVAAASPTLDRTVNVDILGRNIAKVGENKYLVLQKSAVEVPVSARETVKASVIEFGTIQQVGKKTYKVESFGKFSTEGKEGISGFIKTTGYTKPKNILSASPVGDEFLRMGRVNPPKDITINLGISRAKGSTTSGLSEVYYAPKKEVALDLARRRERLDLGVYDVLDMPKVPATTKGIYRKVISGSSTDFLTRAAERNIAIDAGEGLKVGQTIKRQAGVGKGILWEASPSGELQSIDNVNIRSLFKKEPMFELDKTAEGTLKFVKSSGKKSSQAYLNKLSRIMQKNVFSGAENVATAIKKDFAARTKGKPPKIVKPTKTTETFTGFGSSKFALFGGISTSETQPVVYADSSQFPDSQITGFSILQQEPRTREELKIIESPLQREEVRVKQEIKIIPDIKDRNDMLVRTDVGQKQRQQQDILQKVSQIQEVKLRQSLINVNTQQTKTRGGVRNIITRTKTLPEKTITFRKPPTITDTPSIKSIVGKIKAQNLFDVFVKRKGKDIQIAEDVTLTKAKNLLRGKLTGSLAASGFITTGTGERKVPVNLGFGFRPGKRDSLRVVQERGFRLGTRSEVGEIMSFNKNKKRIKEPDFLGGKKNK